VTTSAVCPDEDEAPRPNVVVKENQGVRRITTFRVIARIRYTFEHTRGSNSRETCQWKERKASRNNLLRCVVDSSMYNRWLARVSGGQRRPSRHHTCFSMCVLRVYMTWCWGSLACIACTTSAVVSRMPCPLAPSTVCAAAASGL